MFLLTVDQLTTVVGQSVCPLSDYLIFCIFVTRK